MPGLAEKCMCGENDCFAALPSRREAVLFADGEEAVSSGERCDCVIVLRAGGSLEIYLVELKRVTVTDAKKLRQILNPDRLKQKWTHCLKWAESIIAGFNTMGGDTQRVKRVTVLAAPPSVLDNVRSLIRREKRRYLLPGPRVELRLVYCGCPATGEECGARGVATAP